jgi:hypothetical protein
VNILAPNSARGAVRLCKRFGGVWLYEHVYWTWCLVVGFKEGHTKVGGRQSGTPNKDTTMLSMMREVIQEAGTQGLKDFKDKYPADFWRIASKLLPAVKEITGANGEPLEMRPVDAPPRPKSYEEWLQARVTQRLGASEDA